MTFVPGLGVRSPLEVAEHVVLVLWEAEVHQVQLKVVELGAGGEGDELGLALAAGQHGLGEGHRLLTIPSALLHHQAPELGGKFVVVCGSELEYPTG